MYNMRRMQWVWYYCMPIPWLELREFVTSGVPGNRNGLETIWQNSLNLRQQNLLHGFRAHCRSECFPFHSQSNDFVLAANERAQTDFWFMMSSWHKYITSPCFHTLFPAKTVKRHLYSPCTWFLQILKKKNITLFWIWCLLNQVP